MRFFRRRTEERIEGEIGYHKLSDWWLTAFSAEERAYIEAKFQPLSTDSTEQRPLTKGRIEYSSGSAVNLLLGLASWFEGPGDRHLARRILDKAKEVADGNVLDLHFLYMHLIKVNYRDRDKDPEALDRAIQACETQIELAPRAAVAFRKEYIGEALPAHTGYEQLAIIREKEGRLEEAIGLAAAAKQMGWAGDWERRIERCERKLAKGRR